MLFIQFICTAYLLVCKHTNQKKVSFLPTSDHSRTRSVFIMLHGGARWKVLLERDVEVEQTHGNKIGNAWEGIGVQP